MTRDRYRIVEGDYPYFLTCTVVEWQPLFTRPEIVQIIFDSWRFLQQHDRLTIFGYVIIENHLHLIAKSPDLAKEMGDFKSFTAKQIVRHLERINDSGMLRLLEFFRARHKIDRTYQVWQEGSHPQLIADEEMLRQKLEYMHNNPLKRGYVDDPLHWRYSSARNYAKLPAVFEINTRWS